MIQVHTNVATRLLVVVAALTAMVPARADDIYWVGYQNGCMLAYPDTGSFFHGDNWLNYTVPGSEDVAIFGSGPELNPGNNGNAPHYLYFGDACINVPNCGGPVPGGNVTNDRLEIQSGSWTFDFDTGIIGGGCSLPGSTTGNYTVSGPVIIGDIVEDTGLPGVAALTVVGVDASPEAIEHTFRAYIDGRDQLVLRGNTLYWHHFDYAAVGRHEGLNEPTYIDGVPWIPTWPEEPPAEIRYEAISSEYTLLNPPLRNELSNITIDHIEARRPVVVIQYPTANNDFTTILEFNDAPGGATWYEVTVSWTPRHGLTTDTLTIGAAGEGSLSVVDAGTVHCRRATVGPGSDSEGHVTISGENSLISTAGHMRIGGDWPDDATGTGTLIVNQGGRVECASDSALGYRTGSIGEILVTDVGSTWTQTSGVYIGQGGDGTMTVSNGGAVSNTFARIGAYQGSNGTVTVTGAGSIWNNLGWLEVGILGTGQLDVTDGASVVSSRAIIGVRGGGDGSVTVDGESTWSIGDELWVGERGQGALTVSNGGTVDVISAVGFIGAREGADGQLIVTGEGSTFSGATDLYVGGTWWVEGTGTGSLTVASNGLVSVVDEVFVGRHGVGTLAVETGGTLESERSVIGYNTGSIGTAAVTGIGSTWTNTGNLTVGLDGQGTLTVADGGRVTASTLSVNTNGQVLGDGTLQGAVVNGGEIRPGLSAGVLTVEGDYTQTGDGRLVIELGGTTPGGEYDQLIVTGNASLGGTLEIALINGFVPSAGDVFEIISSSALSGEFSDFTCVDLGGGLSLNLFVNADSVTLEVGADCNGNCVDDTYEIAMELTPDCNEDGVPDECDIADGTSGDCNHSGVPDECDIDAGTSQDADGDGIPDECVFWSPTEGPGLQLWSDPTNWEPQVVPDNAGEDTFSVTIGGAGQTATLDIDAEIDTLRLLDTDALNVTMGDLTLESSFGILNDGSLIVGDGHSLTAATALPIAGSGDVRLSGPDALISSASFGDTLTNRVAIAGEGVIDADFRNDATVTADVTAATLKVTGTMPKVNDGTFRAISGATLEISDANVTGFGSYIADGGTITLLRGLGGGMIAGDSMEVLNGGVFGVGWDAIIDLAGTFTITGCGSYESAATPVSASLTAGDILVTQDPTGGGELLLEGTMSVESLGSIIVGGEGTPGPAAEGCTPSRLRLSEAATVAAENMNIVANGSVEAIGDADIVIQQALILQAGSYTRGSGALPSAATLSAESVTVASVLGVGEGLMILEDAMSITTIGDFVMALDPDCVGPGPVAMLLT